MEIKKVTLDKSFQFFDYYNASLGDISLPYLFECFYKTLPSTYFFNDISEELFKHILDGEDFEIWSIVKNSRSEKTISNCDTNKSDNLTQAIFTDDENRSFYEVFFCKYKKGNCLLKLNVNNHGKASEYSLDICVDDVYFFDIFNKLNERFPIVPKNRSEVSLLIKGHSGNLAVSNFPLDDLNTNLELNYPEGFIDVHNSIVERLNTSRSGLYIFHGDPGTGKTSYLKHLTKCVQRKFIFVPTNMVNALIEPDFIRLLTDNNNVVLILEDAEKAVLERDGSNNSLISTVLNLTDGIVGSILNTSIIVTFNAKKESIDRALLRKGRLKVEYEFKKLSYDKSVTLAQKLGKNVNHIDREGMSIADIYNLDFETFHEENKGTMLFR